MLRSLFYLIILVVVLAALVIRLWPWSADRFHVAPESIDTGDQTGASSFVAVREITVPGAEVLSAISEIARQTPRTMRAAGSLDDQRITFVTRSRVFAFPDYTTVSIQHRADGAEVLVLAGRSRLGQNDHGVNEARVRAWLDALGPLTAPP